MWTRPEDGHAGTQEEPPSARPGGRPRGAPPADTWGSGSSLRDWGTRNPIVHAARLCDSVTAALTHEYDQFGPTDPRGSACGVPRQGRRGKNSKRRELHFSVSGSGPCPQPPEPAGLVM